jgi:hypothetical protein
MVKFVPLNLAVAPPFGKRKMLKQFWTAENEGLKSQMRIATHIQA